MSFLFGSAEEAPQETETVADTVKRHVLRLESSQYDDRLGAIQALRAYAQRGHQVDVGTQATDPVLKVLKEDSAEHELALFAVEMFTFVMTPKDQDRLDHADVGVMFTEITLCP
eukprot:gene15992-5602_t